MNDSIGTQVDDLPAVPPAHVASLSELDTVGFGNIHDLHTVGDENIMTRNAVTRTPVLGECTDIDAVAPVVDISFTADFIGIVERRIDIFKSVSRDGELLDHIAGDSAVGNLRQEILPFVPCSVAVSADEYLAVCKTELRRV